MRETRPGSRFGEVADVYDNARPGYPLDVAAAIRSSVHGPLETIAEIGAGTGHGTAVLTGLAVFGHRYAYVDPAHDAAIGAACRSVGDGEPPPRPDAWARVTTSGPT
jgi:hypothetical protein